MYNTGIPLPPQQPMQTQQGMQQLMQQGAQQQQPMQQGAQQQIAQQAAQQQPMQQIAQMQNMGLGAQSPFTVPGMGNMMPGNQLAGGQNPFAVPGMGAPSPVNQMATQPPIMPPAPAPGPMTQPGFPSNPNVSMPIGAQPVTEGYGGMGGGRLGGLMSFFQSMMGQRGGSRMGGFNMQDMMERMRSRQGDPRRDNLFQRYGAPPPQQPGTFNPQNPVGSPVPGMPAPLTPQQLAHSLLYPGGLAIEPPPPVRPQLTPEQLAAHAAATNLVDPRIADFNSRFPVPSNFLDAA